MTNKSLAKWMKAILITFVLCGLVVFAFVVPFVGLSLVEEYPEFSSWFAPWLVFLELTALPCYAVLVLGWKISVSIADDKAFCIDNSDRLKAIAIISLVTSLYNFVGHFVFLILNMSHFSVFAVSLVITFFGVAISVVSAVLSYYVRRAAKLQEENDLTI